MNEIYKIIDMNGREIGTVYDDLSIFGELGVRYFNDIESLLIYIEGLKHHLNDM